MGFYTDLVEGLKDMIGEGKKYSNPTRMAKACGVAPNQVLRYIKQERGKHIQVIARILDEVGAKIVFPEEPEKNKDKDLPTIPLACSKPGTDGKSLLLIKGSQEYFFDPRWLKEKGDINRMKILTATGDAMSPRLEDGDLAIVDESQKDLQEGRMYAIRIDQDVVIRKIAREPGKIILVSGNPEALTRRIELQLSEESENWDTIGRIIFVTKNLM